MALAYVRQEIPDLLNGYYSETVGQQLVDVVSQIMLDLGWMAYDSGRQPEARRYMLTSLRLSHAAANRLFGSRVLVALSHQSLHLGRVREAIDLAQAASVGTQRTVPPTATAMFASMEACALAASGDFRACEEALFRAQRTLNSAESGEGRPAWLDFDKGGLDGHAARAYRDLNKGKRAQQLALAAVKECRWEHSRTRLQRSSILASALVQSGEIVHAAAIGTEIVQSAWKLHSRQVLEDIRTLARSVDPSRSSAVLSFSTAARELLAARRVG